MNLPTSYKRLTKTIKRSILTKSAFSLFMAALLFLNQMASFAYPLSLFGRDEPRDGQEKAAGEGVISLTPIDTNLKENPEARALERGGYVHAGNPDSERDRIVNEVYRWNVELPGGTIFSFGLQEKDGIRPVVRVKNLEWWYVRFEPAAQNKTENQQTTNYYVSPRVNGNQIEWEFESGVVARYTVLKDRVKADYVINNREQITDNKLDFIVQHDDSYVGDTPEEIASNPTGGYLVPEILSEGDIVWFGENGKAVFTFPRPIIQEANGEEWEGNFSLNKLSPGTQMLSINLPEDKLDKAAYPITVDPQVVLAIDAGDSGSALSYGNSRHMVRDSFGNLFVFANITGNDLLYKSHNTTTWTRATGTDVFVSPGRFSSLDIDSSGNLHVVGKDIVVINYVKFTVTRAGDNSVSSISTGTEFSIDTTGTADRPSMIVANKGEGTGKEKIAVAWAINTSKGGTKRGEIRFLQCDTADDCTSAANWKNASEEKNASGACSDTATSGAAGIPNALDCKGAADAVLQNTSAHTTHHAVLTQVPGRPQRTPTGAFKDIGGTLTNLTNAVDDDTATAADVNGLTTTDYIYVGDTNKFSRIVNDITNTNANAQTFTTTQYCSANTDTNTTCDTWSALSNFIDNTASSTSAFSEDGSILFDEPSGWIESTEGPGGSTVKGFWVRLRPSGAFDATVSIAEFDVTDRHAKDLLVIAGVDDTNDLGAAYVIWDGVAGDKWENKPGDTAVPAPWRQAGTAVNGDGGNWGAYTNFPLTATADYLNNATYVAYVDSANFALEVKRAPNTSDSWTTVSFPAVIEGADMVLSLTSDGADIYLFYVLTATSRVVFRKCNPSGGGDTAICDNSADWGSEKGFDANTATTHPQVIVSKAFGDTVAIDVIWEDTNVPDIRYERHYVDMADNTVVVAASADDALHRDCDTGTDDQDITLATARLGRTAGDASCVSSADSENHVGFRFTGVSVAQGAAISSAYVDFRVFFRSGSGAIDFTAYGEDVDSAAAFSALTDCTDPCSGAVGERTRTTSSSTQSIDFTTFSYRIDVTDMVQEVVCRGAANSQPCVGNFNGAGAWASGNALALLLISTEGGVSSNWINITTFDDTGTTMLDPTLQINVGEVRKNYSAGVVRGTISTTATSDLDHPLATAQFTSVNTDDTDFYSIAASTQHLHDGATPAFIPKANNSNNNNTDQIQVSVIVKSAIPTQNSAAHPGKTIYLQIYRAGATNAWEALASNTTSAPDTDITLSGTVSTNLSEYYQQPTPGGSCSSPTFTDCWAYVRVYQDPYKDSGVSQILFVDNVSFTFTASGPQLTQNDWRIYVDNDALDPTDPWGNPDLAENTAVNAVPPSNDPIDVGDKIRIRISVLVSNDTLAASTEGFILQYVEASDCTTATGWTDVDVAGGAGTWRFAASTVTDQTALSGDPPTAGDLNLAVSDRAGRYAKSDPTTTNPFAVAAGEDMEWDFHIEYNGNAEAHTYCLRLRKDDPADLNTYNSDSYPRIDTRPTTADLLRHGNFFTAGVERGFFWAD